MPFEHCVFLNTQTKYHQKGMMTMTGFQKTTQYNYYGTNKMTSQAVLYPVRDEGSDFRCTVKHERMLYVEAT